MPERASQGSPATASRGLTALPTLLLRERGLALHILPRALIWTRSGAATAHEWMHVSFAMFFIGAGAHRARWRQAGRALPLVSGCCGRRAGQRQGRAGGGGNSPRAMRTRLMM